MVNTRRQGLQTNDNKSSPSTSVKRKAPKKIPSIKIVIKKQKLNVSDSNVVSQPDFDIKTSSPITNNDPKPSMDKSISPINRSDDYINKTDDSLDMCNNMPMKKRIIFRLNQSKTSLDRKVKYIIN